MKTVTVYVSDDNKVFNDQRECEAYEESLQYPEVFKVINPHNSHEWFSVKKDKKNTIYIDHWAGNYLNSERVFYGTLENFLKTVFKYG